MLFDKNGYFYIDNNQKQNYDFAINMMPTDSQKLKIYDLNEALKKGNLFPNLYDEYKNYKPGNPKADTKREAALLEIQKLEFSITDLNLYLDLNPNDNYAYKVFKTYIKECKAKKEEYTKMYGPLMLDDLTDEYEWYSGVWPWEEGGM